MFVTDFTAVELPLEEAVRRLLDEAPSRLADHAGAADAETATLHLRVGPAIDSGRGPAKTVRATLGGLRRRGDRVLIPLRWEATGAMGMILPSLDADLELAPLRPDLTQIALYGRYEPPLHLLGRGLDRLFLHRLAQATIRAFLRRVATALTDGPAAHPSTQSVAHG